MELVNKYKSTKKALKKSIKSAILQYEHSLANDKKNPKRLYKYINSKQSVSSAIHSLSISDGSTTNDRHTVAHCLNAQFCSVFVDDSSDTSLPTFDYRTNLKLSDITITSDLVLKYLTTIDTNKSQGPDGINSKVLRRAANSLCIPITLLFQKSIESGTVPSAWLDANVTPLFKKGSRLEASNYRPISLTSVLVKILEKIIKSELMKHLSNNKLISNKQHGFVHKKACVTNLLETMDFLTANIEDNRPVDLILLDFAKAFDKVPHNRLAHKLEKYGITGNLLNWIKSFLTNRRQRVVLGNVFSEWAPVTSSVPQGSVLGPTLFIIYINDLTDSISGETILYADDTKILSPITSTKDRDALQLDLNNVINWTNLWLMRLNIEKCKVMHFGKHNQQYTYTLNDYVTDLPVPIKKTEAERDLGIQLTSDLKFSRQCSAAASKANYQLGLLKRTFISRDKFLWKKLYLTYIRPHVEFAVQAWSPFYEKDINMLEKVQRRATKISPYLKHASYEDRCKILNITSLKRRRIRGDLIQKFKLYHVLDEISWYREPTARPQRASRLGVNRCLFVREITKKKVRFHFFNNRVPQYWNLLPDDLINSVSINSFKAGLDGYLPNLRFW